MSFQITAQVMRTKFGSSQRKCIALKMADCANDDGTKIYPAVKTIAEHAEVSESFVRKTLSEWRSHGLLIQVKQGGGGPKETSEYEFDLVMLGNIADGKLEFKPKKQGKKNKEWELVKASKLGGDL